MTLATASVTLGKKPHLIVEMDLDVVTSATAAYASDGTPCYNTPETSKDAAWQPLTTSTRTLRFCSQTLPVPFGMSSVCHPCIISAQWSDDKLEIGRGLGQFGEATIELQDFADYDRTEDPYYSSRTTVPSKASFFRRLIKRTRYFHGRNIRLIWGYHSDTYDATQYETRNYRIYDISGPNDQGVVTIRAVGPLALLKISEAEVPVQLGGELLADLAIDGLSFSLSSDSIAATFPSSGMLVLGNNEIVDYTRTGNAFTLSSRGQEGTTAQSHSAGESVEPVLEIDESTPDMAPSAVVRRLLTEVGLDSSYIDASEWDALESGWFKAVQLQRIVLAQPKPVMELIKELCLQFGMFVWYDAVNSKVRITALRPPNPTGIPTWTDEDTLLDPVIAETDFSKRVSRVDVYGGLRSPVENDGDIKSYRFRLVGPTDGEETTQHQEPARQVWFSRWIDLDSVGLIARGTQAAVDSQVDGRTTWKVTVPASAIVSLEIGGTVWLDSKDFTDYAGDREIRLAIITSITPLELGHTYSVMLQPSSYAGRWAWAAANASPDYDVATEAEKDPSAFACDGTTLLMPNGDLPYRCQ